MGMRNIIVGQSGGPTSVINSSLAGLYKTAIERGFDKVYGMLHGIQGFLDRAVRGSFHADSFGYGYRAAEEDTFGISWFLPLQTSGDP